MLYGSNEWNFAIVIILRAGAIHVKEEPCNRQMELGVPKLIKVIMVSKTSNLHFNV